jgi:hypothetical protein
MSAAETAARELEMSQRPWITAPKPILKSPLTIDMNGTVNATIQILPENVSNNVAIGVSVHRSFGPGTGQADIDLVRKLCTEEGAMPSDPLFGMGSVVFPHQTMTPDFFYDVSNKEIQKDTPALSPPLRPHEYVLPAPLTAV